MANAAELKLAEGSIVGRFDFEQKGIEGWKTVDGQWTVEEMAGAPSGKRVPASSDFQTPPLAAPTKSVILPDGSRVPAMAEMRPLIAAEPMLRAPRPEMLDELNGACCPCVRSTIRQNAVVRKSLDRRMR